MGGQNIESFMMSMASAKCGGLRSTAGKRARELKQELMSRRMSALSLHTMRRVTVSSSSGTVNCKIDVTSVHAKH